MFLVAFTFILNAINVVISNPATCSSVINDSSDELKNCIFQPNKYGNRNLTVRCDVLNRIEDYDTFVDHTFYFHVKLLFEIIEPMDSTTVCMRLSTFHVDKVTAREPWDNATIGDLSKSFHIILRYVEDEFFFKTKYRNMYPAAFLYLNSNCTKMNKSCNPIHQLKFLQSVKRPAQALDFFDPSFWQSIKNWYKNLGGYDTEIRLDFVPAFGIIKPEYLSVILNDLNITYLRLTAGRWDQLDATFLRNKTFLKVLDLSDNGINDIHQDTFLETPEIEVLVLADNLLDKLPTAIMSLKMLKFLDLSNNQIKKQNGFEDLSKLSSLKLLSLSHMKFNDLVILQPILRNCNESYFQLENLNLSYCNIETLNSEDFKCQKELKAIDLSYNKLREIPSDFVCTQWNLITLNISNNLINKGPNLVLHNNITNLDISNNKLYDVSNMVATGYVNFLDLSRNNISSWSNENVFDGKFSDLNMSYNSINYVSKQMINSFKSLRTIDLGENLFNCLDCSLPEFQKWLRIGNSTDKVYNLGKKEQLTCNVPAKDRGRYIVDIDFDITLCTTNYAVTAGIPVAVTFLIITVISLLVYYYRFKITYIAHLINVKKNSGKSSNSRELYKYDAFVCYSGEDRAWVVGELMPTLESRPYNYNLCLHERDFPLGSIISQNIVNSLQTSKNTIVILTDNFIKSQWCRWELELVKHKLFEDNREFLILIELERLDRSSLPRHLKYLMDSRTYLEWPQDNQNTETAWRKLTDALGQSIRNSSKHEETSFIKEIN